MFQLFANHSIRYQAMTISVESNFNTSIQRIPSAKNALTQFKTLETQLRKDGLLDLTNPQRTQTSRARGNTDAVIAKLDAILPAHCGHNFGFQIAEVHPKQDKLEILYNYYQSTTETASSQFTHVLTKNLNQLKSALITELMRFDQAVLHNTSHAFYKQLMQKKQLLPCETILKQLQILIAAAQTVSGVYACVAIGADLFAQMGLAYDQESMENSAKLFVDQLPAILKSQQASMTLGIECHDQGSAFQLEYLRNSLIAKLENYLTSRANLENIVICPEGKKITRIFTPIDLGFFYNVPLQLARIRLAAKLLTQIECMHLEDGTPIQEPSQFATLVQTFININQLNYETLGNRYIHAPGTLDYQLNNMMDKIKQTYAQQSRVALLTTSDSRSAL